MVPGPTLRYGSNFLIVTRSPLCFNKRPIDAAAIPLPSEEITPPVMNINLTLFLATLVSHFVLIIPGVTMPPESTSFNPSSTDISRTLALCRGRSTIVPDVGFGGFGTYTLIKSPVEAPDLIDNSFVTKPIVERPTLGYSMRTTSRNDFPLCPGWNALRRSLVAP